MGRLLCIDFIDMSLLCWQPNRHVTFKGLLTWAACLPDYVEVLSSMLANLYVKPITKATCKQWVNATDKFCVSPAGSGSDHDERAQLYEWLMSLLFIG